MRFFDKLQIPFLAACVILAFVAICATLAGGIAYGATSGSSVFTFGESSDADASPAKEELRKVEEPKVLPQSDAETLEAEPVRKVPRGTVESLENESLVEESEPAKRTAPSPEEVRETQPSASMEVGPVKTGTLTFGGLTPGSTSLQQLFNKWGKPEQTAKISSVEAVGLYRIEEYGNNNIEVQWRNATVQSITVWLTEHEKCSNLVRDINLERIRPLLIRDDMGKPLGKAFPEKGIILTYAAGTKKNEKDPLISMIMFEKVCAETFLMRAEEELNHDLRLCQDDVLEAMQIEADNPRSTWLMAKILVIAQLYEQAYQNAQAAVIADKSNPEFRITYSETLGHTGEFETALKEANNAIKLANNERHLIARASRLMGALHCERPDPNMEAAMENYKKAIAIGIGFNDVDVRSKRLAAKDAAFYSHLGMAAVIARNNNYSDKQKSVNQWLHAAEKLAADLEDVEKVREHYRFKVATEALDILTFLDSPASPDVWAEKAQTYGKAAISETSDDVRLSQIQRELGSALFSATQICKLNNEIENAIEYCELAAEYLDQSAKLTTRKSVTANYKLGVVYFWLGVMKRMQDAEDNNAGIREYELAIPLLEEVEPIQQYISIGRHGKTFVKMGLHFWKAGQQKKAIELLEAGVVAMHLAIAEGQMEDNEMITPYRNLAHMYRETGQKENAKKLTAAVAKLTQKDKEPSTRKR